MTQQTVEVKRDIRSENRAAAEAFRQAMSQQGTLVVWLISSPGSGKTSLLAKTAEQLRDRYSIGVLVGDVQTERDAERLRPFVPAVQITTGGACHLEFPLVERALPKVGTGHIDMLFIEDVGNLICPASHELGEHLRVIVLSATEGDDKPGKYPKAFRTSDVLVISKLDLLPYVPFSIREAEEDALRIQPKLAVFPVSSVSGDGLDDWCEFLEFQLRKLAASKRHDKSPIQGESSTARGEEIMSSQR